jgi:hypothetical protein
MTARNRSSTAFERQKVFFDSSLKFTSRLAISWSLRTQIHNFIHAGFAFGSTDGGLRWTNLLIILRLGNILIEFL